MNQKSFLHKNRKKQKSLTLAECIVLIEKQQNMLQNMQERILLLEQENNTMYQKLREHHRI